MMSRILSCTPHKHRTHSALIRCVWGCRVTGEGKWGVRCENDRSFWVQLFETKEEAERSLELRWADPDPRHNRGYLIQVDLLANGKRDL